MDRNKKYAPSAERNQAHIQRVLDQFLTKPATILEIGSGTGQHAAFFAKSFPDCYWIPSDIEENLASIDAWAAETGAENISPALELNLENRHWPVEEVNAVICINTIHIVSWSLVKNLFRSAGKILKPGGVMYVYGPYEYDDRPLEPSNVEFNQWLKNRDPDSGIRNFDEVNTLAKENGFKLVNDQPMPANNRSIWWSRPD